MSNPVAQPEIRLPKVNTALVQFLIDHAQQAPLRNLAHAAQVSLALQALKAHFDALPTEVPHHPV